MILDLAPFEKTHTSSLKFEFCLFLDQMSFFPELVSIVLSAASWTAGIPPREVLSESDWGILVLTERLIVVRGEGGETKISSFFGSLLFSSFSSFLDNYGEPMSSCIVVQKTGKSGKTGKTGKPKHFVHVVELPRDLEI